MDPTDLRGEAGAIAALFVAVSAALAGLARHYAASVRNPSPLGAKARPPRLDRKQLLSLLENSARNARSAQIEAFHTVVAVDEAAAGGASAFGFARGAGGGGGRRRPPSVEAVVAAYQSRVEEFDAQLLAANSPPGGAPLSEADVTYALRYYGGSSKGGDAAVAKAEAAVLAADPLVVARDPKELAHLLEVDYDSSAAESDPASVPTSPEAVLAILKEVTDAAPSHFMAVVQSLQAQLQMQGAQPNAQFPYHAAAASRGAAMREVLAPGAGSAWAGRQASFEFTVELLSAADRAFAAAVAAMNSRTVSQLTAALSGRGDEDEEV